LTGAAQHAGEVGQGIAPQGHLALIEGATALTAFDAGQMFTNSVGIHLELMITPGHACDGRWERPAPAFRVGTDANIKPTCAPAPGKSVDQTV
jgi:hypothetical protein